MTAKRRALGRHVAREVERYWLLHDRPPQGTELALALGCSVRTIKRWAAWARESGRLAPCDGYWTLAAYDETEPCQAALA